MTGWNFTRRPAPGSTPAATDVNLRVDLRGVTPSALADATKTEVEQHRVTQGRGSVTLGELFQVSAGTEDALVFEGDLSNVDRVGWQLDAGRIEVRGDVGHYAGACMTGGELSVLGSAGHLVGCEMAGGRIFIDGHAGDFVASTLPGSMDGMRGGTLLVRGDVGARCGDRMRRGTVSVFGRAGDFLGSRMVAGTLAVGGAVGAHPGYGMRRGSIVLITARPTALPGFVPAGADADTFWQLLARDLARHGGPLADLPRRRIERWLGDTGAAGKGEIILLAD